MDRKLKEMTYKELEEINERGEVDKSYLGYDLYKHKHYIGTIVRVSDDRIMVDTSGAYRRKKKPAKVS